MTVKNIHFLASYPKSGNTWCRAFLANYLEQDDGPVSLRKLGEGLSIASGRDYIDSWTGVESSLLTEHESADLRKEGLRLSSRDMKGPCLIKVHDAFPDSGEPDWYPSDIVAGVVYIVRNPLDIAKSLACHMGVSIDEAVSDLNHDSFAFSNGRDHLPIQLRQTLHSWSRHVRSWLEGCREPLCLVRYEDMLAAPVESFGKIVRATGCEPDGERLLKAIRNSDFQLLKKDEQAHGFKEKSTKAQVFFREGKAGTWRKYLSEQNVHDIIDCHGEQMQKLGYLDSAGEPSIQPLAKA